MGLLFVGRSLPVLRLASISGESGICPGKLHSGSSSLREMEEDQAAAAKDDDGEGHWMLL